MQETRHFFFFSLWSRVTCKWTPQKIICCLFSPCTILLGMTNILLYSDCLRRESNFLASTHRVTALCVRVCCVVYVCDCVMVIHKPTRKKCNIRTCTRQWPDALKPKCYSLIEGNQTIGSLHSHYLSSQFRDNIRSGCKFGDINLQWMRHHIPVITFFSQLKIVLANPCCI